MADNLGLQRGRCGYLRSEKSKSKTFVTAIARVRASKHAQLSLHDEHNWNELYYQNRHLKTVHGADS